MKKTKRLLALLLTVVLLLSVIPLTSYASDIWTGNIATSFSGTGDGLSEETAYEISSGAELAYLAQQVNSGNSYAGYYFKLTDDIDLANIKWTPIGMTTNTTPYVGAATWGTNITLWNSQLRAFKGSFDGQNYTVSNLSIGNGSTTDYYQGLFGIVQDATIKNLNFAGTLADVSAFAGGLVGLVLDNTVIRDCDTTGMIFSSPNSVNSYCYGGIAGAVASINSSTKAVIEDCDVSNVNMTMTRNYGRRIGGLVGYVGFLYDTISPARVISDSAIEIKNCTTSGFVSASGSYGGSLGGLIGESFRYGTNNTIAVAGCFSSCDVTTGGDNADNIGGLIGYDYSENLSSRTPDGTNIIVDDCHTTGEVKANNGYGGMGGLIGRTELSWTKNTTTRITNCTVSGDVYSTGPNVGDVNFIGGLMGEYKDLRGSGNIFNISGCGVDSNKVAVDSTSGAFGQQVGGLIGRAWYEYADSIDVDITDCYTTCEVFSNGNDVYDIGGFIGRNWINGTEKGDVYIADCRATGDVHASGTSYTHDIGGFVGYTCLAGVSSQPDRATVVTYSNCSAEGDVWAGKAGGNHIGGFVGYNAVYGGNQNEFHMIGCSATGSVKSLLGSGVAGGFYVGGLVGYLYFAAEGANSGTNLMVSIVDCYATGDVSTEKLNGYYVGGLMGYEYMGGRNNTYELINSYATGNVSTSGGSARYVGGLSGFFHIVGTSNSKATISGCYATGDVSTTGVSARDVGGLIGRQDILGSASTYKVIDCYATGDVSSSATIYGNPGGLVGYVYSVAVDNISVENSYATGNVTLNSSSIDVLTGAGGLIGVADGLDIINCYAIGSVTTAGANAGGLVGVMYNELASTSKRQEVTNCYATGTVKKAGSSNLTGAGGFIGRISYPVTGPIVITNCYFDATTTAMTAAVGVNDPNVSVGIIQGIRTEEMIDINSFAPTWGVQNNIGGMANGSGNDASPWYIDDSVTYPYLYYQYDGHTSAETNYNIGLPVWNKGSATSAAIYDRTDFDNIAGVSQFTVKTLGAARMYFPYASGKNIFITETITVPDSSYNSSSYSLYSLGSISATNIVAYQNMPYAKKDSDREDKDGDGVTDTYVGDTVTYDVTITNAIPAYTEDDEYKDTYYDINTWRDVVMSDPLAEHVTFVVDSVKLSYDGGMNWTDAAAGTGEDEYIYDDTAGVNGTLYVYLQDLEPEDEVIVKFQVVVGEEAVGLSIRNKGTAEGLLKKYNKTTSQYEDYTYTAVFDDRNDDPVKDAYGLSYDGGTDGATSLGVTRILDGYFLTGDTVYVKDNADTSLGFIRSGYYFTGWNTQEDGTGDPYVAGDTITFAEAHIVLYAQWEENPAFRFYKVDSGFDASVDTLDDETLALEGAKFALYVCNDTGGGAHTHSDPSSAGETGSCWELVTTDTSASDGLVEFIDFSFGKEYLLVETQSPEGYELPIIQWLITVDATTGNVTAEKYGGGAIESAPISSDDPTQTAYYITNLRLGDNFTLPVLGGGMFWFALIGILLLAGGAFIAIRIRKKNGGNVGFRM